MFGEIPSIAITHTVSTPSGTAAITDVRAVLKLPLTATLESNGYISGSSEFDKGHDIDNGEFEELHDRKVRDGSFDRNGKYCKRRTSFILSS